MQETVPALLIVGLLAIVGFYFGRAIRLVRLPSIIGVMILGIILGPSVPNIIDSALKERLSFITQISLGFVALSIGLELRLSWLRKHGAGIILTIFGEWFGAFIAVALCIYAAAKLFACPAELTSSGQILALALVFGALATATAPAGTVAIIREYRAKGSLTQTLYAVVGYDDALAVIIFGLCAAAAQSLLANETGGVSSGIVHGLSVSLGEVFLSLIVGAAIGILFCVLARNLNQLSDMLVLIVGFVLVANGLSAVLHLSFILTNMVFGFIVGNTQPHSLIHRIHNDLELVMPLFFIFLFGLAGAGLNINVLPHVGVLGIAYIASRSVGKILGARVSAAVGGLEEKIKKYLGLCLLSHAGVAIGLALVLDQELRGIGVPVSIANGEIVTSGDMIGSVVLTTIMASCVFFEIIGPILARIALNKAGEIPSDKEGTG